MYMCSTAVRNPVGIRPQSDAQQVIARGTIIAQLVHIGAMYTPWLGDVLGASPVSFAQWLNLLGLALSVLVVMELHKWFRSGFTLKPAGYLTAAG